MMKVTKTLNLAIFTLIILTSTASVGVLPVRAELSPDAGIESEQFEVQQAENDRVAAEEAQKEKDAAEAKKAAEKKKADAAKKAAAAEAAKKAKAAAALKQKEEMEKKLGDVAVAVSSTLMASTLYQDNFSVAQKDVPQGLTPVVASEALSTKPGKSASVTIKTLPGATCNIDVYVVTRTPAVIAGLEDKTANEEGLCSWTWTTKSTTPRGSWGIRIMASKDGKSDDTWTTLNIGAVH
ncbi:MAG: hypothetical protein WCJ29_05395 [bacterium]